MSNDRRLSDVTAEELARLWTDAETYAEGESPEIYGWRRTNRWDREDLIDAARLCLRALRGESPVPGGQTYVSRPEFCTSARCDACAESYPCDLHKDQPGDSYELRHRQGPAGDRRRFRQYFGPADWHEGEPCPTCGQPAEAHAESPPAAGCRRLRYENAPGPR